MIFPIAGVCCAGMLPGHGRRRAIGNGYLDAAIGGLVGIVLGSGLLAIVYPRLDRGILHRGDYGELALPQLLQGPATGLSLPTLSVLIVLLLAWLP